MQTFTIRSILAASDLSERSDAAVRAAAAIAELTGAALHILHAYEPEAARTGKPATFPERIETAEQALDAQIGRVVPARVPIASRKVEVCLPHKAILDRAEHVSADLIVLGRHRHGSARAILGSTADHVVHESTLPCLIVPGVFRLPLRSVVVPIDPLNPAPQVARLAYAWATALGVIETTPRGTVLYVASVLPDNATVSVDLDATVEERLEAEIGAQLQAPPAPTNVDVRWIIVRDESPAAGILRYATEVDADLLVLGTSAPGTIRRAILGSVASAVSRTSETPVLLVPVSRPGGDEAE